MYIKDIQIKNIKLINKLQLHFEQSPGWHVFLGDNGSGKTTLARAIAIVLAGANEIKALRKNWLDWLQNGKNIAAVRLDIHYDKRFDKITGRGRGLNNYSIPAKLNFKRVEGRTTSEVTVMADKFDGIDNTQYLWGDGAGWFCASFGPYRRFSGGNKDYEKLYFSNPRLAPHLSVFGEDVALSESLDWLIQLHIEALESQQENETLNGLSKFINESKLLPHGTKLSSVTSKAVLFEDGNGNRISVDELSDGYRSILSLTFELIRLLIRTYGHTLVFKSILEGDMRITLPGVVVIDEIDAHLHPSWQMRIGEWFTRIFPDLQFLVTTHSALICHSAVKGSVWKLSTPGTDETIQEVKGESLNRLVYGTILEAYGTGLFGANIGRSEQASIKLKRLAALNVKFIKGQLTDEETQEHESLMRIFPTAINAGL